VTRAGDNPAREPYEQIEQVFTVLKEQRLTCCVGELSKKPDRIKRLPDLPILLSRSTRQRRKGFVVREP